MLNHGRIENNRTLLLSRCELRFVNDVQTRMKSMLLAAADQNSSGRIAERCEGVDVDLEAKKVASSSALKERMENLKSKTSKLNKSSYVKKSKKGKQRAKIKPQKKNEPQKLAYESATKDMRKLNREVFALLNKASKLDRPGMFRNSISRILETYEEILKENPVKVTVKSKDTTSLATYFKEVSRFNLEFVLSQAALSGEFKKIREIAFAFDQMVRNSSAEPENVDELFFSVLVAVREVGCQPPFDVSALRTARMLSKVISQDPNSFFQPAKYNELMRLYLTQHKARGDISALQAIESLFREINDEGLKKIPRMYYNMLHALGRQGKLDEMFETFEGWLREGLEPNHSIALALLESCCIMGDVERAEKVFANMRHRVPWESGVWYEEPLWRTIWNGFAGYSNPLGIVEQPFLYSPSPVGVKPLQFTKKGSLFRSRKEKTDALTSKEIANRWPKPQTQSYNAMLRFYSSIDDKDRVNELYSEMKNFGIPSDHATASILTENFSGAPYGRELLQIELPEMVWAPDRFTKENDLLRDGIFGKEESSSEVQIDLHKMSRNQSGIIVSAAIDALANAIIKLRHLEELNRREDIVRGASYRPPEEQKLVVITGKGSLTSKVGRRGPILRNHIHQLLRTNRIPFEIPAANKGQTHIKLSDLDIYIQKRESQRNATDRNKKHYSAAILLLGTSGLAVLSPLLSSFA